MTNGFSRRDLMKLLATLGVGTAARRLLSPTNLLAQTPSNASNYRALVCITLDGGCDSNNLVVPMQQDQYASYLAARPDLAHAQSALIPFKTSTGSVYGFSPSIPTIASMYGQGQCAVIANTGPLFEPITKQSILNGTGRIPANLMNHELQRAEWGTSFSDVSAVVATHTGWGGRIADALQSYSSGLYPMVTSLASGAELSFAYGANSFPAILSPGDAGFPTQAFNSLQLFTKISSNSTLISAATDGLRTAYQQDAAVRNALASAPMLKTVFPNTPISLQLKQIANLIACRSSLGLQRQIFLAQHVGFDLHQFQNLNEATVLGQLDSAVAAFLEALTELGISDDVLTFTTSDFNRTLIENSGVGTDHAWGGHHLVFGTGMKTSDMYGTFPSLVINGPDDFLGNGAWIPSTPVDQYGATLASWMGVPDNSLISIFPNLQNFPKLKLGFV